MQEILNKIPDIVELAALGLMGLVIFATVVARFTVTKKDDELVSKGFKAIQKVVAFLPTIGINPNTKKMEETIAELKAKEAAQQEANKPPAA